MSSAEGRDAKHPIAFKESEDGLIQVFDNIRGERIVAFNPNTNSNNGNNNNREEQQVSFCSIDGEEAFSVYGNESQNALQLQERSKSVSSSGSSCPSSGRSTRANLLSNFSTVRMNLRTDSGKISRVYPLLRKRKPSKSVLERREEKLQKEWTLLLGISLPNEEKEEPKEDKGTFLRRLGLTSSTSSNVQETEEGTESQSMDEKEEEEETPEFEWIGLKEFQVVLQKGDQQIVDYVKREAKDFVSIYGQTVEVTSSLGTQLLAKKWSHLRMSNELVEESFLLKSISETLDHQVDASNELKKVPMERRGRKRAYCRRKRESQPSSHIYCFNRRQRLKKQLKSELISIENKERRLKKDATGLVEEKPVESSLPPVLNLVFKTFSSPQSKVDLKEAEKRVNSRDAEAKVEEGRSKGIDAEKASGAEPLLAAKEAEDAEPLTVACFVYPAISSESRNRINSLIPFRRMKKPSGFTRNVSFKRESPSSLPSDHIEPNNPSTLRATQ